MSVIGISSSIESVSSLRVSSYKGARKDGSGFSIEHKDDSESMLSILSAVSLELSSSTKARLWMRIPR